MPDLLTHLGTSYIALRGTTRRDRLILILLGGALPDLAWIVRRAVTTIFAVDPVALSTWLIPWHTPFVLLAVTAAIAAFARRPWSTWGILYAAVLLHHLLDAAQTRFGNGVLWLYPVSLRETTWSLFWPESLFNHLLAILSLLLLLGLAFDRFDRPGPVAGPTGDPPARPRPAEVTVVNAPDRPRLPAAAFLRRPLPWLLAAGCAAIVMTTVAATRERLIESNVYGMQLVTRPDRFEGRPVALDRDRIIGVEPLEVEAFNGRRFHLEYAGGTHGGDAVAATALAVGDVVSLRGDYGDGVIRVRELHRHQEGLRDLYSYLGCALLAVLLVRRRRRGMIPG